MPDSRAVIPAMAWINMQVIVEADKWQWFHDCTRRVIDANGYEIPEHYRLVNPALTVSLLYCLLVVPKEVWLTEGAVHHNELERRNPLKYFDVESNGLGHHKSGETDASCLIRRLRNSIVHATYTVQSDKWTFTDRRDENTPPDFIVRTSMDDLSAFISDIGAYLANVGLASRRVEVGVMDRAGAGPGEVSATHGADTAPPPTPLLHP